MMEKIKIHIPAAQDYPTIVEDVLQAISRKAAADLMLANRIHVALSEAFNNAFLYSRKDADSVVRLEFDISEDRLKVCIINLGRGISNRQLDENKLPSDDAEGGRGISIMKKVCDVVKLERTADDLFCLHLEFDLNKQLTGKPK